MHNIIYIPIVYKNIYPIIQLKLKPTFQVLTSIWSNWNFIHHWLLTIQSGKLSLSNSRSEMWTRKLRRSLFSWKLLPLWVGWHISWSVGPAFGEAEQGRCRGEKGKQEPTRHTQATTDEDRRVILCYFVSISSLLLISGNLLLANSNPEPDGKSFL